MTREKVSSITLAQLDRAMEAFRKAIEEKPGDYTHAVFMAMKSYESDRDKSQEGAKWDRSKSGGERS